MSRRIARCFVVSLRPSFSGRSARLRLGSRCTFSPAASCALAFFALLLSDSGFVSGNAVRLWLRSCSNESWRRPLGAGATFSWSAFFARTLLLLGFGARGRTTGEERPVRSSVDGDGDGAACSSDLMYTMLERREDVVDSAGRGGAASEFLEWRLA